MKMHKPHFGTQGQSTKQHSTKSNPAGGGACGQPMGKLNKPCKPHMGAQGQRKAGGKGGAPNRPTNARRG